jgi:hypothetical protein
VSREQNVLYTSFPKMSTTFLKKIYFFVRPVGKDLALDEKVILQALI